MNKKKLRKVLLITVPVLLVLLGGAAAACKLLLFQPKPEAAPVFVSQRPSSSQQQVSSQDSDPRNVTVNFLAAGDNLIHSVIYQDAQAAAGGNGYVFTQMYADVKPEVEKNDFAFINQESILGGTQLGLSTYPCFNSPQEVGDAIVDAGFNIISLANNHALDRGFKAIQNSCEYWKSKGGVITSGTYETQADSQVIPIKEEKGVKMAFIADTWETNGLHVPSAEPWCVENNFDDVLQKTAQARKIADVVLVSMHWGTEYTNEPDAQQKQQAQQLADAGADIIIGNHPHAIQPIEWLTAADGRRAIVDYALGNFLSGQDTFQTMVGGMLELPITRYNGTITLGEPRFLPLVTYYETGYKNFRVYLLSDYTKTMAEHHGLTALGTDMSPEHVSQYVSSIIAPEFLKNNNQ